MPTYERLCDFLRDDLKRPELAPAPLSVREVVKAIKKFNTSGTLCWLLAREMSGGSDAEEGLSDLGSTQRVFAHCAKAVIAKVEAAVAVTVRPDTAPPVPATEAAVVAPVESVVLDGSSAVDKNLLAWLSDRNLLGLVIPLQALGVHCLEDLTFAVEEGDVTAEALVEAGAGSRVQARRLIRDTAALLESEA